MKYFWIFLGVYMIPILLGIIIMIPTFRRAYKKYLTVKHNTTKGRFFIDNKDEFIKRLRRGKTDEELSKTKRFLVPFVNRIFSLIFLIYYIPSGILMAGTVIAFGPKFVRRLPLDAIEVWNIFCLVFVYLVSPYSWKAGAYVASLVVLSTLYQFIVDLQTDEKKGTLNIFLQKVPPNLVNYIFLWSILALGFASFYYALSQKPTFGFGRIISIRESIFYSFYAVTNIREDYLPATNNIIKWVTMSESLLGYFFSIVFVSVFITVWLNHYEEKKKNPPPPELDEVKESAKKIVNALKGPGGEISPKDVEKVKKIITDMVKQLAKIKEKNNPKTDNVTDG